jgi:hypothetical protein
MRREATSIEDALQNLPLEESEEERSTFPTSAAGDAFSNSPMEDVKLRKENE